MRPLFLLPVLVVAAHLIVPAAPSRAQACTDDYQTVETIAGTILEIVPAPEPFASADMLLKGPEKCSPLWMQVLKSDAAHCRVGDRFEARGIVVSDPEAGAWNLNPERNMYMRLGQDYRCTP